MKLIATAKLNLLLHITGKYENGYHALESLFAFCEDLFDEIDIEPSYKLSVEVVKSDFPEAYEIKQEYNLLYKLLNFLDLKFDVKLTKKIPIGAGLGGGSCDAGALLRFLVEHSYIKESDLKNVGKFGADIIPCMQQKACFGTGIGDEIIAYPTLPRIYALVIKPDFNISTIDIYKKSVSSFKESISNQDWSFDSIEYFKSFIQDKKNSLLEPILYFHPEIKEVIECLALLNGCFYSNASGSGSACFALFETRAQADEARLEFMSLYPGYKAYTTGIR